ncbi:3598_t:CDS:2 [Funneliformis geosporum]|uniref:19612_t:CDS:1 n=1 Tax=Funneliformis geosporum TaxID=1117311 RepID=A0A9W4WL57_9GLOM|nr:3598_t:CDS:2 [Funneliformis geosporum]CAI2170191.1 19612_t:CDS:2 [Funneliformis geosporum]
MTSNSKNSRFVVFEEKIKELKLSEEEQAAFRKAKSQLQNHRLFVGGYVSRVRKFTIGTSIAISIGSIAIGSQIGFFTGAAAGIRTVKSLPNSQRIFEIIREVQNFKKFPSRKGLDVEHEDNKDNNQSSNFPDEFSSDDQGFNDGGDDGQQSSWDNLRSPSTSSKDGNNGSSWDQIRTQNSGSSTWDKIRQNNKVGQQHKPTSDKYNDGYSNENLPRTKEDFDELYNKGKIRTNQYGDAEVRYEQ